VAKRTWPEKPTGNGSDTFLPVTVLDAFADRVLHDRRAGVDEVVVALIVGVEHAGVTQAHHHELRLPERFG
jgi:hypothetical protein